MSKAKNKFKMPISIDVLNPNEFRKFHARAIKFLLEKIYWDSEFPPTKFDNHPSVAIFIEAFDDINHKLMIEKTHHMIALREWATYTERLDKRGIKQKVRKKKLTALLKRGIKVINKKCNNMRKCDQGFIYFTNTSRKNFVK